MLAEVNSERAAAGRAPLSACGRADLAAQAHSEDQAAHNDMTHTGSDGSNPGQRLTRVGYQWNAWGENVAMGYSNVSSVMNGWMNSSGHRANILSSNFEHIGLGLAYSANGSPYWTQVFARGGAC